MLTRNAYNDPDVDDETTRCLVLSNTIRVCDPKDAYYLSTAQSNNLVAMATTICTIICSHPWVGSLAQLPHAAAG